MKDFLAFLLPYMGTLGALVAYKAPQTTNEWLVAVCVSFAGGGAGSAAKGASGMIDRSKGGK